jgi:hypothetical protein
VNINDFKLLLQGKHLDLNPFSEIDCAYLMHKADGFGQPKKKPEMHSIRAVFAVSISSTTPRIQTIRLTLGKLGTLTRFAQTDFLTLHRPRITRDIPGTPQAWSQGLVIFHQSTCDAVANRTSLTKTSTASHSHINIKFSR